MAKDGNKRPFNAYIKSKMKSRTGIGPLKSNGKTISDDKGMANILNSFFSSVFKKEDISNIPEFRKLTENQMNNVVFTASEIRKKILALKPFSALGPDGITVNILQRQVDSLSIAFECLFTVSMKEGVVPRDWKTANVTPIFKKGSKCQPGNYQPVSLTSIPCKIMESILRDSIMDHLLKNSLINDTQHGFMTNKSTVTNLLTFIEKMTLEIDEGNPMDVIYLDFSKAFDLVPNKRLISKLYGH